MCGTYSFNFTPFLPVISGVACVYIGYRFSVANLRRQEFNKAATEFICAFTNELGTITDMERGNIGDEIETLLANAYPQHRNAFLRFNVYLSKGERAEIEKAWNDYCYGESIPDQYEPERFEQYKYDVSQFEEKQHLAIDNINRLLSFAKIK
jgi:hypothetical protein